MFPEEVAHTLIDGNHGMFTETWPVSFEVSECSDEEVTDARNDDSSAV